MTILLLDNYDSFTYMLADYVESAFGKKPLIIRSDKANLHYLEQPLEAIIISPGPKSPRDAGITLDVLEHAAKTNTKTLGICLGMQAIGYFYGAEVVENTTPVHGKTSEITLSEDPIFTSLPRKINATRYHSLIVKNLPAELIATSHTDAGEIMSLRHISKPIYGLQFHPESCMTDFGIEILQNFRG